MDRRDFFSWLSSLAAGTVASAPAAKPEPCMTPAYAGFDGTFNCGRWKCILRRGLVDNPQRYTGIQRSEFAVWRNHDQSVSKLLFRNADGKLFELQFVPMDEPSSGSAEGDRKMNVDAQAQKSEKGSTDSRRATSRR